MIFTFLQIRQLNLHYINIFLMRGVFLENLSKVISWGQRVAYYFLVKTPLTFSLAKPPLLFFMKNCLDIFSLTKSRGSFHKKNMPHSLSLTDSGPHTTLAHIVSADFVSNHD